ncbi:hypothetical protein HMPREF1529_01380 [Microbacterium sp. oral taxon 186 str. F0373]|uniref:DUF2207 domain-containing protein n=1 Tax=Microbacterium sp. oral taxon 186 TaxID=712383 RepID=UPI00034EC394|nr:DUF2207 domain-containing protein [Microbacterium sp. oral taxon 186]EPD84774.1 hypothetical protein HMPREF1529_01380 [Microbacterium sp. oral taxon 186 str. F0373]
MGRARARIVGAALAIAGVAVALAAGTASPAWAGPATAAAQVAPPASVASVAAAGVDDFSFSSMTADYTLTRAADGTSRLRVVETIVAQFPDADQNHGIRRQIPDSYNGQPLRPELISVTDGDGTPRPSEVEDQDGVFSVVSRSDEFLRGAQTFVLTYTLENVTWVFGDSGLEFYWDVNGVDWGQSFGRVTARLHLDASLAASLTGRMSCYQGVQDAKESCASISSTPDAAGGSAGTVITAVADDVQPHQTLTIAVGFADGTFATFDSGYLASPFGWGQLGAGLLAVGAGALGLRARRRELADEPGRPTIIAEYDPPRIVDALESAVLLGQSSKAIPAEVLEQAVRGSIRILESDGRGWGKPKLIAELVDRSKADGDGMMLLDGLFPGGAPGAQYQFGKQDTRFSKVAQKILAAAETELAARGLRRAVPLRARWLPILLAVASAGLALGLGFVAIAAYVQPVLPWTVIGISVAIAVVVIGVCSRKPLTALGAETRDHLRGLEEFIRWAEADRIRMLQSPAGAERVAVDVNDPRQKLDLYEKLLPYAVVFGQEKQWSAELAVLYTAVGATGPYWYYGSGAFDASSFSAGIGSLSSAAMSSSSSSGGSGGGGSAGGGGGGGGGGGV